MELQTRLILTAKSMLVRSGLRRRFLARYPYNFDAAQLLFLCQSLEHTRTVAGAIVEVGVAVGETTLFLNNYLDASEIDKPYLALDTFEGFVESDVELEVRERGKRAEDYRGIDGFRINSQAWFDAAMQLNGVRRVRSIRTDVNEFDLTTLGPIAFCLVDVDLYRPTKHVLPHVYAAMSQGAMLIVDDCSTADPRYDGALQAYREFTQELGKPAQIVQRKLGIVSK